MPETITLKKSKDCKGSVRFDCENPKAEPKPIVTSIYVSRPQADKWNFVTLTVDGK